MASVSMQAAEALYPTLSVFHAAQGHPLKSVCQVLDEGSLQKLILDFGAVLLTVTANEDDDTVDLAAVSADQSTLKLDGQDISSLEPWTEFIGRSFGWGWLIMNQQGYIDGVLLSFSGLDPQLLMNVIASSIKISQIARLSPQRLSVPLAPASDDT